MHLTRETDYALRIMQQLAMSAGTLNTADLSEMSDVNRSFTLKILWKLSEAGLVVAHRGVGGGYSLLRPAQEITVLEIVEAVQGTVAINACLCDNYQCEHQDDCNNCPFHRLLQSVNQNIARTLSDTRLSDCVSAASVMNIHGNQNIYSGGENHEKVHL